MSNSNDWYADYLNQQREKADRVSGPRRQELMDKLAEAGVAKVHVEFDGSGDSGQLEEPTLLGPDDAVMDDEGVLDETFPGAEREFTEWKPEGGMIRVRRCEKVRERLEEFLYDLLSGCHPGWEINEGSFGGFEIDVAANKIGLTFNERFETYETSEEEY